MRVRFPVLVRIALAAALVALAACSQSGSSSADAQWLPPPGADAPLGQPLPDGAATPPRCRPGTCNGCCADKNTCVSGTENGACGSGGLACDTCSKNATCTAGRCVSACGPDNCPGCCDKSGACVTGDQTDACGSGGGACTACSANQSCSGGQCVSTSCSTSCNGCCDSAGCEAGDQASACGSGGGSCAMCGTNETCSMGSCVVDPGSHWDIVAVSADLSATDSSGSSWDPFGGLPDGYMYVKAGGNAVAQVTGQSATVCDTLSPNWNNQVILSDVPASTLFDKFEISVWDDDGLGGVGDDEMCVSTDLKNSFFGYLVEVTCTNGTVFRYSIVPH